MLHTTGNRRAQPNVNAVKPTICAGQRANIADRSAIASATDDTSHQHGSASHTDDTPHQHIAH